MSEQSVIAVGVMELPLNLGLLTATLCGIFNGLLVELWWTE